MKPWPGEVNRNLGFQAMANQCQLKRSLGEPVYILIHTKESQSKTQPKPWEVILNPNPSPGVSPDPNPSPGKSFQPHIHALGGIPSHFKPGSIRGSQGLTAGAQGVSAKSVE